MKKLFPILFLLLSLHLNAQNTRSIGSYIYGDLYLGLMFTGEYGSGGGGLGLGYRITDQHSLGMALHGFSEISVSTSRSASCIGMQYRYQLQRWHFDAGSGYVRKYRYGGDDPYPPKPVHESSKHWYYRLGVRRQTKSAVYFGLSYAQSAPFVMEYTDTDATPQEVRSFETRGVYAFMFNIGLLFQKRK